MPNTTNFNWSTPADTDLVKNGASAIRTLGNSIDTSFVDLKGGTTGQVLKKTSGTDLDFEWGTASSGLTLINTTSFSAVSSQSINDVFSATYDNYMIVSRFTTSLSGEIRLRFRVSGSDNTTNNYGDVTFLVNNTTTRSQNVLASSSLMINATDSTNEKSFAINILQPFASVRTQYQGTYAGIGGDVTGDQVGLTGGGFDATTSFTGFTIFPGAGNITGSISVYGYSK